MAEDSRDLLQSASPSIGPDGKPALLLTYLHDVKGALRLVKAADGSKIADIPLPGPGAVSASSDRDSSEIFFKFASFTNPGTVYRFDAATASSNTELKNSRADGAGPMCRTPARGDSSTNPT